MKKKYNLLFLFVFCVSAIDSQSLLHYAISTNGEKGECLFPEDSNGDVIFSEIIKVPFSGDTIMNIANDYITSRGASDKCVVKSISNSSRTSTYSVQLNIGKQMWGLEYFGAPMFVRIKDASHVKFKCIIEARQGKYKYSLINFETNRNTIRGEAKNDGQPNIIHWQRVNSLTKERDAFVATHNIEKRSVKEEIFDFNSQIAYEACLYFAEYEAVKNFEDGLKHLNFEDDFMGPLTKSSTSEKALYKVNQGRTFCFSVFGDGFFTRSGKDWKNDYLKSDVKATDLDNYKGFLMEIGNNVYVTGGDKIFEQAGVQEIAKQIIIDGYWNLVDDISQAHFVVDYRVNLDGRDKAYILLKNQKGDIIIEKIAGGSKGSSESYQENKEVARSIYLNALVPLAKSIRQKNYPKSLYAFIIR